MTEWREDPMPDIDDSTARVERQHAVERVQAAESGAVRTREAVSFLSSMVATARDLHEANDYVNKMLPFMRGSNRAAS